MPDLPTAAHSDGRPDLKQYLIPGCIVLIAYLLPLSPRNSWRNPNELSRVLLTAAVVEDGTVCIDGPQLAYGVSQDRSERQGKSYSDKAPGLSFLGIPIYAISKDILPATDNVQDGGSPLPDYAWLLPTMTWTLVGIPCAAIMICLTWHFPGVTAERRPWIFLILALCTPLFTYSTVLFGHMPGGLLATCAYVLLLRPGVPNYRPTADLAALAGVLAGYAAATEYFTVVIGAAMFCGFVARRPGWPALTAFIVAGLVGISPLFIYNQLAWDCWYTTGYAFKAYEEHAKIHTHGVFGVTYPTFERLWGVLFSRQRGLFFYCPMLLLVPVGLAEMAKRFRGDAWPMAAAFLGYIFCASGFVDWQAGYSAAARHLMPIVPLMAMPLAMALERCAARRWSAMLATALIGLSLCGALLSMIVTPFFPEIFESPLGEVALTSFIDGMAARNVISALTGWPACAVMLALSGAVIVGVGNALRLVMPVGRSPLLLPLVLVLAIGGELAILYFTIPATSYKKTMTRAALIEKLGNQDLANRIKADTANRMGRRPIPFQR